MNELSTVSSLLPGVGFWIGAGVVFVLLFAIILAKAFRRVVEPNEVHIVQSASGTTIMVNNHRSKTVKRKTQTQR